MTNSHRNKSILIKILDSECNIEKLLKEYYYCYFYNINALIILIIIAIWKLVTIIVIILCKVKCWIWLAMSMKACLKSKIKQKYNNDLVTPSSLFFLISLRSSTNPFDCLFKGIQYCINQWFSSLTTNKMHENEMVFSLVC